MPSNALGGVQTESWEHRVSGGTIPGHLSLNKFGRNPTMVTAGVAEDVWDGSNTYTFLSAAGEASVVSDNAADAAAGTGARKVRVYGLATDWTLQEVEVTLNGITPVVTTGVSFIRIFRVYVIEAGTGGKNAGTLTISVGGTTLAKVLPTYGQTLMAVYTVPAGYRLYLSCYYFSLNSASVGASTPQAIFSLQAREAADVATSPWRVRHLLGCTLTGDVPHRHCFTYPIVLPEKTDLLIRCSDTNSNNSDVSAGFDGVLELM